ncbi:MAG: hypothetical protein ACWA5R_06635 [bacterium]
MNLLEYFVLTRIHTVKLNAELIGAVKGDENLEAKVEINFSPTKSQDENDQFTYQIAARLLCNGGRPGEAEDKPLFTIEYVLNAFYQNSSPTHIEFDLFQSHHHSLVRQLNPIMQQKAQEMMREIGLTQINLPPDLAQQGPKTQANKIKSSSVQVH